MAMEPRVRRGYLRFVMEWWRKPVVEATGSVLFRGALPPRAEDMDPLRAKGCSLHRDADAPNLHWSLKASHPTWGDARIRCLRDSPPIPPALLEHDPRLTDSEKARAQLRLAQDQRFLFPAGPIAAGNGGVNLSWGWHYTRADLAEMSIELCDGRPSLVQADLNYWLGTVKSFCPWGAYVHAELK